MSIVKENTLIEHKYQAKQLDSAFSVTKKVKTFDRNRYSPDGGAKFNNKSAFVWSGNKAKIFDFEQRVGYASIKMLPKEFTSSFHMTFSFDDKYLALQRYGNTIYLWNSNEGKLVNTLKLEKEEAGTLEMFMPDNKTLVLSGEKVRLYDSEKLRVSAEFEPKFMQTGRSFSRVRITAISLSPDGTTLYVGSNKNIVERWSIENGQPRYVDQILDKEIREIGAMTFDEKNTNILVIGGVGNKVNFWDTEKKKVINSYTADERMNCRNIRFSDDGKYMMAVGEHGAFLWQIGNETQLEIVKGDKIAGAMFLPDSTGFVTMGKDVDVWQINEQ